MNDELTELEYEHMLDTVLTASEWHSGQWSALYSYSSTGEIHGPEHREDLLREIDGCLRIAGDRLLFAHGSERWPGHLDRDALEHLRYTIECWPDEAV